MAGPELTPLETILRRLEDIKEEIESSNTAWNDRALNYILHELTGTIAELAIALKPLLTSA